MMYSRLYIIFLLSSKFSFSSLIILIYLQIDVESDKRLKLIMETLETKSKSYAVRIFIKK